MKVHIFEAKTGYCIWVDDVCDGVCIDFQMTKYIKKMHVSQNRLYYRDVRIHITMHILYSIKNDRY